MSKKNRNHKMTPAQEASKAMRRAEREGRVAAMREGRRIRSTTFADRKKVANKKACRGKVAY